jgi:hypothetical protein
MTEVRQAGASGSVEAQAAWTTLIDDIRIDDDPTSYCSTAMDTTGLAGVWIEVLIDSTLAPTLLRILAQYSRDGGVSWGDFEEGLWASLAWEDTDTAFGIDKFYLLPCGGIDLIRICAIGTGTDAGNFFDVSVYARGFIPAVPVAHA